MLYLGAESISRLYLGESEIKRAYWGPTVVWGNFHIETVDARILISWHDENDAFGIRPNSVDVSLFRDGEVYETATLSLDNSWRKTWTDLPIGYNWSIDATDVPYYEKIIYYYENIYRISYILDEPGPDEPGPDEPGPDVPDIDEPL